MEAHFGVLFLNKVDMRSAMIERHEAFLNHLIVPDSVLIVVVLEDLYGRMYKNSKPKCEKMI